MATIAARRSTFEEDFDLMGEEDGENMPHETEPGQKEGEKVTTTRVETGEDGVLDNLFPERSRAIRFLLPAANLRTEFHSIGRSNLGLCLGGPRGKRHLLGAPKGNTEQIQVA